MEEEEPAAAAPPLHPGLVKALLHAHWTKEAGMEPPQMAPQAAQMAAELFRIFIGEAKRRAEYEAKLDGDDEVEPQHLERVAITMLTDF